MLDVMTSDHRINDFPGFDDADWVFKGQHARKYRQLGAGKTRVISVYTGLFLEILISPFRTSSTMHALHASDGMHPSGLRHCQPDLHLGGLVRREDRDDGEGRHRARARGACPPHAEPGDSCERTGRRARRGEQRELPRGARHRPARARGARRAARGGDQAAESGPRRV